MNKVENSLVTDCPLAELVGDWRDYLLRPEMDNILGEIRKRNLSGLPLGESKFIESLARDIGLKPEDLVPKALGRPKKI